MIDTLAPFLEEVSIFSSLSLDERRYAARLLTPRNLEKGATLFAQGDAGDSLYVVRTGTIGVIISTEGGGELTVATLGPGDFLGEMSVFEHAPRSATCRAIEDAEVLQLHESDFHTLIHIRPRAAIAIMQAILEKIVGRLENTGALLSEMVEWGETARSRAFTDELTGMYNRRYLDEILTEKVNPLRTTDAPLTVIMLDLDNFTALNGQYGPHVGDKIIVHVSNIMRETFRDGDILVRYGGDEFIIVLPRTSAAKARRLCAKLRSALASRPFSAPDGAVIAPITTSQGIAVWPDHGATAKHLISAADSALYRAKAKGRDCVEITS